MILNATKKRRYQDSFPGAWRSLLCFHCPSLCLSPSRPLSGRRSFHFENVEYRDS
jgi:hypothetical protein